ncbi:hypothetical protein, partial [Gelidibacter salicanalis]|uniref:hypothetical protein n=1 Tax=Gelidibacter salicanalis TaxID=291193 RepID=UPI001F2FE6BD
MVTLVTKSLTLFIYLNEIKTDPQVYRDKCHAILQLLLNIRGHLGVTMAICNELDDLEIYTNFHRIFYHPQESGLNPSVAKTFEIY